MQRKRPLIDKGIKPRGHELTREIDRSRRHAPKTYVPFKERMKMGRPEARVSPSFGGNKKRKAPKPTLPKLACLADPE